MTGPFGPPQSGAAADPLGSRYGAEWFALANQRLDAFEAERQARRATFRHRAKLISIVWLACVPLSPLRIPVLSMTALIVVSIWFTVPAAWIVAAVKARPNQPHKAVLREIERAQLWERTAAAGRASRAAGPPSSMGWGAWQTFAALLAQRPGSEPAQVAFTPDHPFWQDPNTASSWDRLWAMSIADTNSFPTGVKKLLAESRQRHDAWFATLPHSDPQTYMAIEQLRHQRRMEAETHRQTTAAEAAAASAAQTAANSAAIARNTASIANSTQATANELEWRRRNNR